MEVFGNILLNDTINDIDFEQVENILKRPVIKPRYRVSVLNPDESVDYVIPETDIPIDGINFTEEYQNGQRKNVTLQLINENGKLQKNNNVIPTNIHAVLILPAIEAPTAPDF